MVAGSGLKIYDTMKYSLLFFAALCLAFQAANAQEVTVRMIDNASKSITLGERMSPETVWNRFGVYAAYSFDDTEYLYGHIDHYNTEGLGFTCFNSTVHSFATDSKQYRVIIDRKYILSIGMNIRAIESLIPATERTMEKCADNSYVIRFIDLPTGIVLDDRLILHVDSQDRIICIGWEPTD